MRRELLHPLGKILDAAISDGRPGREKYNKNRLDRPIADLGTSALSPRWPSGIYDVDKLTEGGFYGFTVVGGPKKLGKSMVTAYSTLMAAKAGWRVLMLRGEGTDDQLDLALEKVLFYERDADGVLPAWYFDRWDSERLNPTSGFRVEDAFRAAFDYLDGDTDRLLICIDSINRIARYDSGRDSGDGYLRAISRACQIAQSACESSGGDIGVMMLTETNQRGGFVGMDIEYSAGCLLRLRKSRHFDSAKLVLESRESPGGDLGLHTRNWNTGRFERGTTEVVVNGKYEPETAVDDWAPQRPLF
jgi:hypothetical protein